MASGELIDGSAQCWPLISIVSTRPPAPPCPGSLRSTSCPGQQHPDRVFPPAAGAAQTPSQGDFEVDCRQEHPPQERRPKERRFRRPPRILLPLQNPKRAGSPRGGLHLPSAQVRFCKGLDLSPFNFKANNSFASCEREGKLPHGHILEAEKRIDLWPLISFPASPTPPWAALGPWVM